MKLFIKFKHPRVAPSYRCSYWLINNNYIQHLICRCQWFKLNVLVIKSSTNKAVKVILKDLKQFLQMFMSIILAQHIPVTQVTLKSEEIFVKALDGLLLQDVIQATASIQHSHLNLSRFLFLRIQSLHNQVTRS